MFQVLNHVCSVEGVMILWLGEFWKIKKSCVFVESTCLHKLTQTRTPSQVGSQTLTRRFLNKVAQMFWLYAPLVSQLQLPDQSNSMKSQLVAGWEEKTLFSPGLQTDRPKRFRRHLDTLVFILVNWPSKAPLHHIISSRLRKLSVGMQQINSDSWDMTSSVTTYGSHYNRILYVCISLLRSPTHVIASSSASFHSPSRLRPVVSRRRTDLLCIRKP